MKVRSNGITPKKCSECTNTIPLINSKGKKYLTNNYHRMLTCSTECATSKREKLKAEGRSVIRYCSECNGEISQTHEFEKPLTKENYKLKMTCSSECNVIRKRNLSRLRSLKLGMKPTPMKESAQLRRAKLKEQVRSEIPIGTKSRIDGFIYKVGAHGFFYRANVDNDDYTRADPNLYEFCKGIFT